ncbi:probable rRNA maturation factor [Seinonella peptonophila]|uniref:Endoribonuclease YbeY n=1 Tax=Seinonella peptonophila TaxID=112248 RepID=A0A1M4V7E9_9BACL|nr:rRNA maturation RNase YbeY [Seinonella peptonophila]SHE64817.1 probable rRNA maturation factor [Seinonella peptonophila]
MDRLRLELNQEVLVNGEIASAISRIKEALQMAAEVEDLPLVEVSLTLVGNERIRQLNHQFRDRDQVTDVLSFPLWEDDEDWILDEDEDAVSLGDIIVSVPRAMEQADEYGHSIERELSFLAVHGFLHLLGYDHQTEAEERAMFQKQEQILERIGMSRHVGP